MSCNLPSINALLAFEAAARLGSIRQAGTELALSHTVVSRHIRTLEARVGTKLVISSATGVALTDDGLRYHREIGRALKILAEATDLLHPPQARGEIRIWCAAGLATRWLTRRLPEIEKALAPTEIVLTPTDRMPRFSHRDADVAITYGMQAEPSLQQEILSWPRMFPVASPDFLRRTGPVVDLEDLARRPLLHEDSKEQWRRWLQRAGMASVPVLGGPRLWYADVTVEAALQGQGVALANPLLVRDELAAGRLQEVLVTQVTLDPYVLRAPVDSWNTPSVRRLHRWLKAELGQETLG
ncbi:LysR substrate-binding domain-containing protein [Xanthobacter sp. ZOL 2024]